MQNTYGVLLNGAHVDVSNSLHGAKCFATKNGYSTVTIRYNCGYIAKEIAHKYNGKWKEIKDGQIRYNRMLSASDMPEFGTKEFNDLCSKMFGGNPSR